MFNPADTRIAARESRKAAAGGSRPAGREPLGQAEPAGRYAGLSRGARRVLWRALSWQRSAARRLGVRRVDAARDPSRAYHRPHIKKQGQHRTADAHHGPTILAPMRPRERNGALTVYDPGAPVRGAAELISRWALGCRLVGSRPFKAGNRLLGGGGGTAYPWLSPRAGLCLRPRTAEGSAWTRSVLSSHHSRLDPSARPRR